MAYLQKLQELSKFMTIEQVAEFEGRTVKWINMVLNGHFKPTGPDHIEVFRDYCEYFRASEDWTTHDRETALLRIAEKYETSVSVIRFSISKQMQYEKRRPKLPPYWATYTQKIGNPTP